MKENFSLITIFANFSCAMIDLRFPRNYKFLFRLVRFKIVYNKSSLLSFQINLNVSRRVVSSVREFLCLTSYFRNSDFLFLLLIYVAIKTYSIFKRSQIALKLYF